MYQPDQTFFLKSPGDLLEMLRWQLGQLKQTTGQTPRASAYCMIQCAQTAWALCDWVWAAMDDAQRLALRPSLPSLNVSAFRDWLRERSAALNYCRYLTDAFKHKRVERKPDPLIESIDIGFELDGQPFRFWVITDSSNQIVRLDHAIEEALQFWTYFLNVRSLDGPSNRARGVLESGPVTGEVAPKRHDAS
ncbi:hypothetical protein [Roseateles puraquae]|nr:hypothetical protein [Roseateles puraquae]MDG0852303.1 hypothetical protein [Roseateles puraquae]